MVYRAAVKTGVIFKDGKNKAAAKQFVALPARRAEPDAVRGGLARPLVPGHQGGAAKRLLEGRQPPLSVYNQFMSGTVPFEFTKNYKFTVLNNENVWAKARTASSTRRCRSTRRRTS
jgi:multiple sugar transport system substrate-binding protein